MSGIRFCNVHNGVYPDNDPDAKQFAATKVKEGEQREIIDICGPCVRKGWGSLNETTAQSLTATEATVIHDSETGGE